MNLNFKRYYLGQWEEPGVLILVLLLEPIEPLMVQQ